MNPLICFQGRSGTLTFSMVSRESFWERSPCTRVFAAMAADEGRFEWKSRKAGDHQIRYTAVNAGMAAMTPSITANVIRTVPMIVM